MDTSAPKIFSSAADALEWVVNQEGVVTVYHCLDNFLIVAPAGSRQCEVDMQKLVRVFDRPRVPIAVEKLDEPAMVLTF